MDRTRIRLLVLVIAQIAGAFALGKIDEQHPAAALCDSLLFGQLGLLAVWLVFGSVAWPWRVGSFLAGTTAIVWWNWNGTQTTFDNLIDIVVPELIVALGLVALRYGPTKLRLIQSTRPMLSGSRQQFSLRQLMMVIMVVAVVVSFTRPIRAYVSTAWITDESGELTENEAAPENIDLLLEGTFLLGIVVVSWISIWAALGIAGWWARSALALVLTLGLASLFAYAFAPLFPGTYDETVWYCLPLLVGQSIFTMATLFVVRVGGYRLVGPKEMATQAVTT